MSRWIFALQAGLFCQIALGSVLMCYQTANGLKCCCTEPAEMAILGTWGEDVSSFCTLRAHNVSVIESCPFLLSFTILQKHENFNLGISTAYFSSTGSLHAVWFFLCLALPGFICSKQRGFPPVPLGNCYEVR